MISNLRRDGVYRSPGGVGLLDVASFLCFSWRTSMPVGSLPREGCHARDFVPNCISTSPLPFFNVFLVISLASKSCCGSHQVVFRVAVM